MTSIDDVVKRIDELPLYASLEIKQALLSSLLLIEADARRLAPRDRRHLAGSINHKVTGTGLAQEGRVGPSMRYGAAVEFGRARGAKMPPVDALIPWVQRHWRPALVGKQRVIPGFERELFGSIDNKRRPARSVTDARIRRRAFALARAISKRGIPPNPYMRPAFYKNQAAILNEFRQVGRRVAAEIAGQQLA